MIGKNEDGLSYKEVGFNSVPKAFFRVAFCTNFLKKADGK